MAQATTLEGLQQRANPPARPAELAVTAGFFDGPSYALLRDIAKDFAASDMVPQRYQGKPANCMIAVEMAIRMSASPLMVLQNLYIVHGTPGWSSSFLIACFNQCGRFDSVQYEFYGQEGTDEWGCRAFATTLKTGTRVEGSKVTIALAKKEGWYAKNGSKWQTMPEQMLRYRAAAFMIRTNAPEIGMGFQTREEVEDTYDMDRGQDGTYRITSEEVKEAAAPLPAETTPPAVQPAMAQQETPKAPRPTAAEMNERREQAKEAWAKTGQDLTLAEGMVNEYADKWTSGQCSRIMEETAKLIRKCPRLDNIEVPRTDCEKCSERAGCPAL